MPKMHCFSKQIFKMGALLLQRPLILGFGDLKLRDVVKFCFFKTIMTKLNFKKSVMTLF